MVTFSCQIIRQKSVTVFVRGPESMKNYFSISTNQLAVFVTACSSANQILIECCISIIGNFTHNKIIPTFTVHTPYYTARMDNHSMIMTRFVTNHSLVKIVATLYLYISIYCEIKTHSKFVTTCLM